MTLRPLGRSIALAALSILVLIALYYGATALGSGQIIFADTGAFAIKFDNWFALTNYSSNAFFPWQLDRLFTSTLKQSSYLWLVALHLWILLTGIIAFALQQNARPVQALCVGGGLLFLLYLVFGVDLVIVTTLAWIPWILVLPQCLLRYRVAGLVLTLFVALRFVSSANQLALFSILALLLVVRFQNVRISWQHSALLIIPLLCVIKQFRTPLLAMPLYPSFSSVVPRWGSDLGVQPLIGAGLPLPSIDRLLVGQLLSPLAMALLALTLILYLLRRRSESSLFVALISVSAILCGCVLLDSAALFPINFSQIMPLAALARIIPNLIFVALAPIALALSLLLLSLAIAISKSSAKAVCYITVIIVFGAYGSVIPHAVDPRATLIFDRLSTMPPTQQAAALKILNSPSLAVIKQFGLAWVFKAEDFKNNKFRSVSMRAEISSTHEPGLIKLMRDRKPKTRWTSSLGSQSGKEWVLLRLPEARSVSGIAAPAEPFSTDFPRGLEIASAEQCSGLVSELDSFTSIVKVPNWNGWINFSSDGYPYIEPASYVNVTFLEPVQAQCLLLRQIGQDRNFDWSISELRIADHSENPPAVEEEDSLD